MVKKCKRCDKILEKRQGQKIINPLRKFCNVLCATRYHAKKRYYRLRDNKEFRKDKLERYKEWYENNKERQFENVKRHYHKNKSKWFERRFVQRHRKKLLKLINQKCECGKPVTILHHITYNTKRPHTKGINPNIEKLLKSYAKYLIGFCSKKCHMACHRT